MRLSLSGRLWETPTGIRRPLAEQPDQRSEASILALRDRILGSFGRVDGLVNNAVSRPMRSAEAGLEEWE